MFNYSNLFKNINIWCYATAVAQFIVFLLLFLGVSFASTYQIVEKSNNEIEFISKYEKYVVLASSIYMIVPFAFSNLLLFGLFHKHAQILKIYWIASIVNACVILIVDLGSGIYIAIKGTNYVAYSLIALVILSECILLHGILLISSAIANITKLDNADESYEEGE